MRIPVYALQSTKLVAALTLTLALALAGCASTPATNFGDVAAGAAPLVTPSATPVATGVAVTPEVKLAPDVGERAVEDRVLALDPNRISDDDVRTVLAAAPTPHIILIHGGVIGVYLMMESFGNFLVGMGYPVDKIRDPHDGAFSQNPYGSSERLAGEVAWYYEHDGVRPIIIGHSQGGMQTIKLLYDLAGDYGNRIPVWNPAKDRPEARYTIVDPLTHVQRPVVGLSVAYASVVGTGGVEFLSPAHLSLAGKLREIPDTVDEFTGFSIAGDIVAWTPPGGSDNADKYRNVGNALVHNVNLPASYSHVFVPATKHLIADPRMRAWLNAYSLDNPPDPSTIPQGDNANALWAANVWAGVKKHWCLEAQRLIRARRGLDDASQSQSAQR